MTDIAIVRLGIGLVLLIAANIALGSVCLLYTSPSPRD